MTIIEFPLGYFYIISQLNGLVLDVADIETAGVRKATVYQRVYTYF